MHEVTQHHSGNGHHRHAHRKRMARVYVAAIFGLFCLADAVFFWFTFSQHNPWRILIGLMFGQSIVTVVLVAGILRRNPWARYILLVMRFGVIAIFALLMLTLSAHPETVDNRVATLVWAAIGLVLIGNSWMIRSKRIQYLASQAASHA